MLRSISCEMWILNLGYIFDSILLVPVYVFALSIQEP